MLLLFFLTSALPTKAATRTWDGGGADSNWSTCANWSTDTCPVAGDTVVFDSTSTKDSTIDASAPASIAVLTIASGYSGTLTVAKTFSISTFSQADGNFTASNQAVTFSSIALTNGTFTASSATTIVNGTFNLTGGTFNHNSGTLRFSGSTATLTCNSATFNVVSFTGQTNTKTISSNCSFPIGASPTIPDIIVLNGTLSGTGTLTTNNSLTLNSTASLSGFSGLSQTSGTLTLASYAGSFTSYSPFSVGAVTVSSGDLALPATATTGTLTMSSGTLTASSTLWTITSALTLSGTATLVHNNGTIAFTGSTTPTLSCNNQTFNLVTINWSGNGGGTINSNCSLPLGNNPTVVNGVASSRAFNLNGTLSGTGTLTFSSSAGTTMTVNSTGVLSGFSGLALSGITVAGSTIDLSSYSPVSVNAIVLSSGTLTLPTDLTMSRSVSITGGTFNAGSGTLRVGTDFSVTGSPTFNANGGTIVLDGNSSTITCTGSIFNKVVLSTSSSTTISSNCIVPLGTNPTITGDLILNGTLTGSGTITHSGDLTAQNNASISGFSELTGTSNALTVTSMHLNLGSMTRVHLGGNFVLSNSSTSFTAPALLEITGGVSMSTATFNANGGTVNFNGGSSSITCNNQTFALVTFTGQTGTKTISANCPLPLGNNPTIPTTLTTSSVLSGTGILTMTTGTLTLNAGSSLSGFTGLTGTSNWLTVDGATANFSSFSPFEIKGSTQLQSGTVTFPNAAVLSGNVTVSGATIASTTGNLTINGNLTASSGTINAPSGILTIGGALSFSGTANFVHNSGTVNFTGSNETLTCNSKTFNLVTLNNTGLLTIQSSCSFPLGNNPTVANSVTLAGTLSGTGTLTMTTGTLTLNSTSSLSGFSGFSGATVASSLSTFDASSYSTFSTSGLVTVSAGTLTLL